MQTETNQQTLFQKELFFANFKVNDYLCAKRSGNFRIILRDPTLKELA